MIERLPLKKRPHRRQQAAISILDAMDDHALFARFFRNAESWSAWRVFLCVLFGLPMTAEQLEIYRQCTGRDSAPAGGFTEAWLCTVLGAITCGKTIYDLSTPHFGEQEFELTDELADWAG